MICNKCGETRRTGYTVNINCDCSEGRHKWQLCCPCIETMNKYIKNKKKSLKLKYKKVGVAKTATEISNEIFIIINEDWLGKSLFAKLSIFHRLSRRFSANDETNLNT